MGGTDNRLMLPALDPADVPAVSRAPTFPKGHELEYPWEGRDKRALGDALGLTQFGVNQVRLPPGKWSALRHWHIHEDEFVMVLSGEVTLVTSAGRQKLSAGMVAGFPAGKADGHHLVNESGRDAVYLEVGRRAESDMAFYDDNDAVRARGPWGSELRRRDGTPL